MLPLQNNFNQLNNNFMDMNLNNQNFMNNNFNQMNNIIDSQQMNSMNNNLMNELNKYKNENKKLKEQVNNLQQELNRINQANKKQNDYLNQINNLKNQLKEKDKEINELKNKISNGNIKKYVDYNDIMVVNFISGDGKINEGIKCLPTETFAEVEEKLYKIYDEYRETNNIFLAKGNIIKRFKKISENNIKNGDKIQLQNFNE